MKETQRQFSSVYLIGCFFQLKDHSDNRIKPMKDQEDFMKDQD